jgi:hypothetical protein
MSHTRLAARWATLLPLAVLAFPAPAGALGLPDTFARTIAITGSDEGFRVTRFEVSAKPVGSKVKVTTRVTATSTGAARGLVLAVAPCIRGPVTSPLCPPRVTSSINIATRATSVTRTLTVPRPEGKADALRVTLTRAGRPIPFRPERVAGGGGTGEILLNGGTWRYRPGTRWGIVAAPPADLSLDRVSFNSRTYLWRGTSVPQRSVLTEIGYANEAANHSFNGTMYAGRTYTSRHTPVTPAQSKRSSPRTLVYSADLAGGSLFTLRVPMAPWSGR